MMYHGIQELPAAIGTDETVPDKAVIHRTTASV